MSEQPVLSKPPGAAEIRAELEAMVVGDLLGPAGGESEELTERTVRDRYIVGVLVNLGTQGEMEAKSRLKSRVKQCVNLHLRRKGHHEKG